MVGLVYGLGVCRHMATLVNHLINNSELENLQACAIDNGGHAWNYLRFKNNNNTYTYYKVDTYYKTSQTINQEEITNNFKKKYQQNDVSLDNIFNSCFD